MKSLGYVTCITGPDFLSRGNQIQTGSGLPWQLLSKWNLQPKERLLIVQETCRVRMNFGDRGGREGRSREGSSCFLYIFFFKMPLKKHTSLPIPSVSTQILYSVIVVIHNFCLERGGFSEMLFFPDRKQDNESLHLAVQYVVEV